jgi:hypothetical protein
MYTIQQLSGPLATSDGYGLNDSGDVVGVASSPEDNLEHFNEAAIWYSNNTSYFSPRSIYNAYLFGINNDRSAVGSIAVPAPNDTVPARSDALLINGDGQVVHLSHVHGAESAQEAYAINSSGVVCVDTNVLINSREMSARPLDVPSWDHGDFWSYTINDAGDVAGVCGHTDGGPHGFFLGRDGHYLDLGPGILKHAMCLNNNRQLVGGVSADRNSPLSPLVPTVWNTSLSAPQPRPVRLPQGFESGWFAGINDNDQIVGTAWSAQGEVPFLYERGQFKDLNRLIADPRWVLGEPRAINNVGQITGSGLLDGRIGAAYLLTPVPALPPDESLLQYVQVSFNVMAGGSGWSSRGPVPGPLPLAYQDALMGLAMDAAAGRLSDKAAQVAIRTAALEMTRRSVDSLIAQAKAPAPSPIRAAQGDSTLPRARRQFTRLPMRPKGGPKNS